MILKDLQTYLSEQHRASLAQMEVKFGIDADALRGMLQVLSAKGRVHPLPIPDRCHGCDICSQESLEFYEWVSPQQALATMLDRTDTHSATGCGGACHIGGDRIPQT